MRGSPPTPGDRIQAGWIVPRLAASSGAQKQTTLLSLPVDVVLAVAAAGIDLALDEDARTVALPSGIANRGAYFDGPALAEIGWRVELLVPVRMTFEGRTRELALAWCLIFLMGEGGELGARGFVG